MKRYDFVIVGAGLSACVVARKLADAGKKILIIERRNHIGGNLYDYKNEDGIIVQKYGPHTFHTNNDEVIDFITKYAQWEEYHLKCEAMIDDISTPSPFNFMTIDQFYEKEKGEILKKILLETFPTGKSTIVEMLESNEPLIKEYANYLFDKDYSLYTSKQWGIAPSEVDVSVLKRVPVEFSYKDKYFYDKFEAIPKGGFTCFIDNLLDSKNIDCLLNTNALDKLKIINNTIYYENQEAKVIFTGQTDELFNFIFGTLPYRSLRFEGETINKKSFQNVAIVAYPSHNYSFTRITEYTKLPFQESDNTFIVKEYPLQFSPDKKMEPYYPILTKKSREIYEKYYNLSRKINNLYLLGRLAEFKYYNMDQCVLNALNVANSILEEETK